MFKCFLTLLFISSFALISHDTLGYRLHAAYLVVDDQEASDEKPADTDVKEDGKDKLFSLSGLFLLTSGDLHQTTLQSIIKCSKGFINKPYTPPEAV